MEPSITLYYDIVSPFSYIALYALKVGLNSYPERKELLLTITFEQNSPVFSKCQVNLVPVAIRDLFQKCQNSPPITVKSKFHFFKSGE